MVCLVPEEAGLSTGMNSAALPGTKGCKGTKEKEKEHDQC